MQINPNSGSDPVGPTCTSPTLACSRGCGGSFRGRCDSILATVLKLINLFRDSVVSSPNVLDLISQFIKKPVN